MAAAVCSVCHCRAGAYSGGKYSWRREEASGVQCTRDLEEIKLRARTVFSLLACARVCVCARACVHACERLWGLGEGGVD